MACTTSAIAGYSGNVTGTTGASEVTRWSIDVSQDIYDVTSFESSGFREFILGLKTATGSFDAVGTNPTIGEKTTITFNTGGTGDPSIAGDILITNVSHETPVDEAVRYSADFTFCGSFTVS